MRKRCLFASAVAAIWLPILIVGTAQAISDSRTCRITTYYKTAEMTDVAGVRSTCPGAQSSGRTTRFFEVEEIQLGTPTTGGGGGDPGGLPCEFLAKGCSNLPTMRN